MIEKESPTYKTYSDPSCDLDISGFSESEINKVIASLFNTQNFEMAPISGGLNNLITGGGLLKIRLLDREGYGNKLIAKLVPSFSVEQASLATVLEQVGHDDLGKILSHYPSNTVGEREVETYNFLTGQKAISVPKMYFGYINKVDASALLIMDDLSNLIPLHLITDRETAHEVAKSVTTSLARFHAFYFRNLPALDSQKWLGNWWKHRDSDYLSHEVAQYSLDSCARFISDPEVFDILNKTLQKRHKLWDRYNSYRFATLIHWDLNPTNILVDEVSKATPKFQVIDWQTTTIGIPQWDLTQLLIPLSDRMTQGEIGELIDLYCQQFKAQLPIIEQSRFDSEEFKSLFNLVVVDHSFRSTINVLLSEDPSGTDWEKCIKWIGNKKSEINIALDSI